MKKQSEPACQVCGCTELTPCVGAEGPCSWIAPGVLCSACLGKVKLPETWKEVAQALEVLLAAGSVAVTLRLPGVMAYQMMSLMQFLARSGELGDAMAAAAEVVGRNLQGTVSLTPVLAAMAEAGWAAGEGEQFEGRSALILPGDPGFV